MICAVSAAAWALVYGSAWAQTAGVVRAGESTVHAGGIWKAVVPPLKMPSEFDGFDPIGVAVGARIKADCSLNWINPDDGARYCFSSGTSLEYFLDRPHANIQRAREGWRKLNSQQQPKRPPPPADVP
jgi:hypothetical protein